MTAARSSPFAPNSRLDGRLPRVGFIIPSLHFGGAERWTLSLARFADPTRVAWAGAVIVHEWAHQSLIDALSAVMPVYFRGVVYELRARRPGGLEQEVRGLLERADVVVVWELDAAMAELIRGASPRIVNVAHRDDPGSLGATAGEEHLLATVWRSCRNAFGVARSADVTVIPNGIDLERCVPLEPRAERRRAWQCRDEDRVIGCVSRIEPAKNCVALGRALQGLAATDRGVVYGARARCGDEIVSSIQTLVGDQVRFFDPTEDVGSVLRAIDVFFLPSRSEVLSLALLEAWGAGTPVVATPVGALPDLEAEFGALCVRIRPDDDRQTLADAIRTAMDDTAAQREMRRRARRMVEQHFSVQQMVTAWTKYLIASASGAPE